MISAVNVVALMQVPVIFSSQNRVCLRHRTMNTTNWTSRCTLLSLLIAFNCDLSKIGTELLNNTCKYWKHQSLHVCFRNSIKRVYMRSRAAHMTYIPALFWVLLSTGQTLMTQTRLNMSITITSLCANSIRRVLAADSTSLQCILS